MWVAICIGALAIGIFIGLLVAGLDLDNGPIDYRNPH